MDLIKIANETIEITKQGWYINPAGNKVVFETDGNQSLYAVELYPPEKSDEIIGRAEEIMQNRKSENQCRFYITDTDSFAAAGAFQSPLVMNFANAYHVGGGFRHGARAQEEALCRMSTLYGSISSKKAKEMYTYNNTHLSPVSSDYFLISPNVVVFRNQNLGLLESPYKVSVVTIAAPNRNGEALLVGQKKLDKVMTERLRKMLYAAADAGYRRLILGAWGCGAFRHNPERVAGYFYKLFFEEGLDSLFDQVAFAILGKNNNYAAFKKVLGNKIDSYELPGGMAEKG